jgi:magnesium-transporting ATPase (P-type)
MTLGQLIMSALLRIVLAAVSLPLLPSLIYSDSYENIEIANKAEVFGIIFTAGVVTFLLFEMIFVGRGKKFERLFIGVATLFLFLIFYKNFSQMTLLSTLSIAIASVLFSLRIPIRKGFEKKNEKLKAQ